MRAGSWLATEKPEIIYIERVGLIGSLFFVA